MRIEISLGVIVGVLLVTTLASLVKAHRDLKVGEQSAQHAVEKAAQHGS